VHIGIFGATGVVGRRVLAEAVNRGHHVTAFTRSESRIPPNTGTVTWKVADILDPAAITEVITGLDLVINAINAGDSIPAAIDNADVLPRAAQALVTALEQHPSLRLLVVGGAGSLELRPGLQVVDSADFVPQLPAVLGVPPEYVKVVRAHRDALNLYRTSNRNWTYLSPSAGLIKGGDRTARFRTGTNQLLTSPDGTSNISAEDIAVALINEAELPQHIGRRFTVGY
jgi:putative NADH-flavin reductase